MKSSFLTLIKDTSPTNQGSTVQATERTATMETGKGIVALSNYNTGVYYLEVVNDGERQSRGRGFIILIFDTIEVPV